MVLESQPAAGGQSLIALDFLLGLTREFAVIAGTDADEFRAVLEAIATRFLPHKVVAPATPDQAERLAGTIPLLAHRPAREGRTTTYICEHFACREPVVGVGGVESALPNLLLERLSFPIMSQRLVHASADAPELRRNAELAEAR